MSALRPALLASLCALAGCDQIVGIHDYSSTDAQQTCNPVSATFATRPSPRDLGLADFDGDGKLDIVVSQGSTNTVDVLIGNGDGTFQHWADVANTSLNIANAVAVGDLNGDQKPDVVVTNENGSSAAVLLSTGGAIAPYFQTPVVYSGPVQPGAIALADFDGNMRNDLAITGFSVNAFGVLLNNGDGTFQADVEHATCSGPSGIASADFNGDGKPDVAVACSASNTVGLFLNAGGGNFTKLADMPVGQNPLGIVSADVNGDGKLDLIVSNHKDDSLTVLIGDGNGAFAAQPPVPTGTGPQDLATADLDGDGHLDIAVGDFGANAVSVLHGNGDGTFQPKIDYPAGMGVTAVAIGKLDGDATPDLAIVDEIDANVTVLRLGACQ